MKKIFTVLGVSLALVAFGGYIYLNSVTMPNNEILAVAADEKYLADNQAKYADCYYTVKLNSEFITSTVINRFYNQGAPKDKLTSLESQFLAKYNTECDPIITAYESRYGQYGAGQLSLAEARQSKLDKMMKKSPIIEQQRNDVASIYEKYDPKSLQYPTYTEAKMLYTADEFTDYLNQNL